MMDYYDITIGQYLEIKEVFEADVPELDKMVSLIAICFNMTEDEVLDLEVTKFNKYVNEIDFIYSPYPKEVIKEYYVLDGQRYEVHLNLSKLTAGQYIDFQTFIKEPIRNLVEILSVFLIPEGKKYGDYDMEKVHKDIKEHMNVVDALAISGFFLLQFQSLTESMLTYLKSKLKKMKRKEKNKDTQMELEKAIQSLERIGGSYR